MKLKIIWSKFAENQLDKIYNYYEKKATPKILEKHTQRCQSYAP